MIIKITIPNRNLRNFKLDYDLITNENVFHKLSSQIKGFLLEEEIALKDVVIDEVESFYETN